VRRYYYSGDLSIIFLIISVITGFVGSLFMLFISPFLVGRFIALGLFVDDIISALFMTRTELRRAAMIILLGAVVSTVLYSILDLDSNPYLLVLLVFPALGVIISSTQSVLKGAIVLSAITVLFSLAEFLAFLGSIFGLSIINYTVFPLTWSGLFILASLHSLREKSYTVHPKIGNKKKSGSKKGSTKPRILKTITFVINPPDAQVIVNINDKPHLVKGSIKINSDSPVKWYVENVKLPNGVLLIPEIREGIANPSDVVKINMIPIDLKNWDPIYWVNKNLYNYKVLDVVGTGGNSYVLKAELNGKYYAIKIPKMSDQTFTLYSPVSSFLDFAAEASNLINLSKDDRLVKLYAINVDSNVVENIEKGDVEAYLNSPPMIVMEYLEGGTLMDLMKNPNLFNSRYWKYIVYVIIKETILALNYIHSQGYVHLDIKPQNIFFSRKLNGGGEQVYNLLKSSKGVIKLGDLGSAVRVGGKIKQITVEYAPPEQLEFSIGGIGADPRIDVFSLGMTMYVALTGYNNRPDIKVLSDAVDLYNQGKIREALIYVHNAKRLLSYNWININAEPDVQAILRRALSPDPLNRPSLNEFVSVLIRYIV